MTSISGKPMRIPGLLSKHDRRRRLSCHESVAVGAAVGIVASIAAACIVLDASSAGPRQFATSVNLVEAYVTVSDPSGAPVTGLQSSDFEVLDDGKPQAIQAFAAGDFPLSVALAIDHSASMAGNRLRLASVAARSFLGRLQPSDQAMILGVSSEVEVLAPLSTDRAAQARAIEGLQPWSTTSLNDAIITALDRIQPARGRRGLIVLSDGEDRYSDASAGDVLARARRGDVMVYPVALGPRLPPLFPELAVVTGGRSFHVDDPRRLEPTLADIAHELRYQYLLGYAPPEPGSRAGQLPSAGGENLRWHTIQVRVKRPHVRVRARDGYYGR
jgi:Ca-activated chloride channel homolog